MAGLTLEPMHQVGKILSLGFPARLLRIIKSSIDTKRPIFCISRTWCYAISPDYSSVFSLDFTALLGDECARRAYVVEIAVTTEINLL
jgi:hypothetical protein